MLGKSGRRIEIKRKHQFPSWVDEGTIGDSNPSVSVPIVESSDVPSIALFHRLLVEQLISITLRFVTYNTPAVRPAIAQSVRDRRRFRMPGGR